MLLFCNRKQLLSNRLYTLLSTPLVKRSSMHSIHILSTLTNQSWCYVILSFVTATQFSTDSPCHVSNHVSTVRDASDHPPCDSELVSQQWVRIKDPFNNCLQIPSISADRCYKVSDALYQSIGLITQYTCVASLGCIHIAIPICALLSSR